jgi:serine/threonine-protein kinase PknK
MKKQKVTLTTREAQIMILIAEGHSSKEVADKLTISKRTIDCHLDHVYSKLGVKNRVQAMREIVARKIMKI